MADTSPSKPRRFRFRPRMLIALALIAALGFGWLGVQFRRAGKQREAVARIRKLGASVFYNCRYHESGYLVASKPPGPAWLTRLLGPDFFGRVHGVKLTEVDSLEGLGELQILCRPLSTVNDGDLVHLRTLTDLQWLALSDTQVGDAGLEHLRALTQLDKLYLDGTQVTDRGLVRLSRLTRLKILSLSRTQVSDAGLDQLAGLTGLEKLRLDHTHCSLSGVVHLLAVRQDRPLADALETAGLAKRDQNGDVLALDFSKTRVRDAGLAHLPPLDKIQWLYLNGTQITDGGMAHLAPLTTLELVHLADTRISDAGLEHLQGLKSLRTLHLTGTRVTGEGVAQLEQALPDTLRVYWKPPGSGSGTGVPTETGSNLERPRGPTPDPKETP